MKEIDTLIVTVIVDNYYDSIRADTPIATRFRSSPGASLHAEHGLSYSIETTLDGQSSMFLIDYGMNPHDVIRNMELLGINTGKVKALALSHGHFDHWGGLMGVLGAHHARLRRGTPLYVGRDTFRRRFSLRPGEAKPHDIGQLSRKDIEATGVVNIVEVDNVAEVVPDAMLFTNIERNTPYEEIPPSLLMERDENLVQDTFEGEMAFACVVRGKGLVVVSGCAHTGIVNTVLHARKMTGIDKVHAIMGGFHLINAKPEVISQTVRDIKAMSPDFIIPTHCTGFEAITLFAREMPDQFILNTSGTKYTFTS